MAKLKQVKSSWTPLSNCEANQKIFDERRALVCKWFDKWTDGQRKTILEDLVSRCKVKQLVFAEGIVSRKKPTYHDDFMRVFPRALSIYLFSFLDPRSLCRCAQVCWNWKYTVELDQLWMEKAIRRGWILSFSPSPYETGTWKRLYVENASNLKYLQKPKVEVPCLYFYPENLDTVRSESKGSDKSTTSKDTPVTSSTQETVRSAFERVQVSDKDKRHVSTPRSRPGSASKRPPWKGSDPTPKDTWRNNYLQNDDEVSKINKLRLKGLCGPESEELQRRAKNKVNTGLSMTKRPSSLPRAKSAQTVHHREVNGKRPDWAKPSGQPGTDPTQTSVDAGLATIHRPIPVRSVPASPQKIKILARQHTDPEIFTDRPWQIPDQHDDDSDT